MIKKMIQNKIIKGNLNALFGNMAQAVFGFFTFLLLVRFLDKYMFGQWVIFITVATLLDMLRLGLTGTAAIRLISSQSEAERPSSIGSSYHLSLLSTAGIAVLFLVLYFIFNVLLPGGEYAFILLYYPLLAIGALPFHQANVVAQGDQKFNRSTVLKAINGGLTLSALFIYLVTHAKPALTDLILICILTNSVTSLVAIAKGWDGLRFLKNSTRRLRKEIMHFGKYATAGYIGSNLLKSADTFILTLVPFLGPEAIAIYSIPLKFVELVEIPLRSFSSAAFPQLTELLSKKSRHFFQLLLSYTFFTTLLLVPVVAVLLSFPTFFLHLMGGQEYVHALGTQQAILYVIGIYILLLPSDRFTGVALFAMDKPKMNFIKISIMLAANIIFDLLAVLVFHSLIYVAVATLIFTAIGVVTGWRFVLQNRVTELPANLFKSMVFIKAMVR